MFWVCYGEYRGRRALKPFLAYYYAKSREKADNLLYQVYLTDAAKVIAENTARIQGGSTINTRFVELLSIRGRVEEEDTRECAEIAASIWERIRGEKK